MTAAKPFPRCPERASPTLGELRAQLAITEAERDLLAAQSAGVLLAAMRAIVREADAACHGATVQAVGIATLQAIRKMALDALADAKGK